MRIVLSLLMAAGLVVADQEVVEADGKGVVLYVGACIFLDMTVIFPTPLTIFPATMATTINMTGTGLCEVVTSEGATSTETGVFTATAMSVLPSITCAGGIALGRGGLSLSGPPGFPSVPTGDVVIAYTAAAAVVALTQLDPDVEIAGIGEFVQDPADTLDCVTTGLGNATWTGTFTFVATTGVDPPTTRTSGLATS